MEWCLANDIDVVNMSFGMKEESEILHNEVEKLEQAGMLMVAAAGNNGEKKDKSVEYPAAYPEVIAVGSVDPEMQKSQFSAEGKEVEIAAPGEDVPITSYWELKGAGSGTSYAAPHVAAVASLLWSCHPEKKAIEIRELLCHSAEGPTTTSKETSGNSQKSGYGIVNYQSAKELLDSGWENGRVDAMGEKAGETSEKEVQKTGGAIGVEGKDNGCHKYEIPQGVQGSWAYNHHQHLITTFVGNRTIDTKQRDIAREVSYYVDANETMKTYNVLHARGQTNYVSATYCLFEAARKWGGSITTQAQLKDWLKNYKSDVPDSANADGRSDVLHKLFHAAEIATTKIIDGKNSSKSMPKATTKAIRHENIIRGRMQLLGFAIHLAGDVYAHKSMCVTDKFAGIAETTFTRKDGTVKKKPSQCFVDQKTCTKKTTGDMVKIVNTGNLTTAGLGRSYFSGDYYWLANNAYTDSIKYMPERYNIATKNASYHMLNNYCRNVPFTFYAFCPVDGDSGYKFRTKYLTKYLTQTVNGFYGKYNKYTKERWETMSHD